MKSYEGIVDDWIWYISFISLSLHVSTHVNTQVSEPGIVGTVNSMLIQIHVDIAMSNRTCQEALSLDEVRLLHLDGFLTVWLLHASCDPGFCLPWAPKPVVLLDWQEHDKWDALKLMFRRERESLEKLREDKARSWLICSSAHTGLPIVYIYMLVRYRLSFLVFSGVSSTLTSCSILEVLHGPKIDWTGVPVALGWNSTKHDRLRDWFSGYAVCNQVAGLNSGNQI